jgi:hypothetical protein
MTKRRTVVLVFPSIILGLAAFGLSPPSSPTIAAGGDIVIAMEGCKAARPASIASGASALSMIFSGRRTDELVKRGSLDVDGTKYTLYLPKSSSYSIKNSKPSDSGFENTSTLISVDQKGNGVLTEQEGWFANMPIRLGDKMFDVAEIAADGSRIVLKASTSPLRGVIIGRKCPPFSFKTTDGKEVTLETLSGKAMILDIWSIT